MSCSLGTANTVVAEMVYVHSKLLIVDDAVAIIGSANINDRSLSGNGDTELAAVIADDAEAGMNDVGQGIRIVTRKFARELRIQLWKKHLGMSVDQTTTGVSKQGALAGINIDKPLDAGTIAGIKKLATRNRAIYSEVFLHTPRDSFKTMTEGRQAYKVRFRDRNGKAIETFSLAAKPDLQPAYMSGPGAHNVAAATARLTAAIKGFWVEMPLDWGVGQATTPRAPVSPSMIAIDDSPKNQVGISV